jgi:CRP-like cAMP-binding protein
MYGSSKNLYFEIAVLRSEFATWGPLSMPGVSVGEDGPMKKNGRSISQPPHPRDNCLFAALPQEDAARLLPHLEPRTWALGDVLYDPDRAPAFLYFPTTAMVSLVYTLANGLTGEMGVVGREGVVGVALFMGGASTTSQALIQSAGSGFRLRAAVMHEEFQRGGAFHKLLLRYTQALLTQIAQTAVCNRLHAIEQRLCRWLLLTQDRVPPGAVRMTHEFIGQMLAVRRESITLVARRLQAVGVIRYTQGHITIVDRQGLEARVCECYEVVQNEFVRLLGWGRDTGRVPERERAPDKVLL